MTVNVSSLVTMCSLLFIYRDALHAAVAYATVPLAILSTEAKECGIYKLVKIHNESWTVEKFSCWNGNYWPTVSEVWSGWQILCAKGYPDKVKQTLYSTPFPVLTLRTFTHTYIEMLFLSFQAVGILMILMLTLTSLSLYISIAKWMCNRFCTDHLLWAVRSAILATAGLLVCHRVM